MKLILSALALALLCYTGCSREAAVNQPEHQRAAAENVTLPLFGATNRSVDANIFMPPAPLPQPCETASSHVRFCTAPFSLTLDRPRYDFLSQRWGQRKSRISQLRKFMQLSQNHFAVSLHDNQERPLIWLSPYGQGDFYFFPVKPEISQIQHLAQAKTTAVFIPESDSTARVHFPAEHLPPLSKYHLGWQPDGLFHFEFLRPQPPYLVVIDPGHGGSDQGAVRAALVEAQLNLELAKILGAALTAQGVRVEYTRTTDQMVPLVERSRRAQVHDNTLFISLHHDLGSYDQFNVQPFCMFTRFDLAELCCSLADAVSAHYREQLSYTKRSLLVLEGYEIPALLIEVLNLQSDHHFAVLRQDSERLAFYQRWSEIMAGALVEQLRQASLPAAGNTPPRN